MANEDIIEDMIKFIRDMKESIDDLEMKINLLIGMIRDLLESQN